MSDETKFHILTMAIAEVALKRSQYSKTLTDSTFHQRIEYVAHGIHPHVAPMVAENERLRAENKDAQRFIERLKTGLAFRFDEISRLRDALSEARSAIQSLPADALGYVSKTGAYRRDELVDSLAEALCPSIEDTPDTDAAKDDEPAKASDGDELLPCPLCGGEATLSNSIPDGQWWWVNCQRCDTKTSNYLNKQGPIKAWSRRASTDGEPCPTGHKIATDGINMVAAWIAIKLRDLGYICDDQESIDGASKEIEHVLRRASKWGDSDKPNAAPYFPQGKSVGSVSKTQGGATLRDEFAKAAMAKLMPSEGVVICNEIAELAYEQADAMLAAREVGK